GIGTCGAAQEWLGAPAGRISCPSSSLGTHASGKLCFPGSEAELRKQRVAKPELGNETWHGETNRTQPSDPLERNRMKRKRLIGLALAALSWRMMSSQAWAVEPA